MVKGVVKKMGVKAAKKTKASKTGKAVKPAKKTVSKPAPKTAKKKSVVANKKKSVVVKTVKKTAVKAKPVKVSPRSVVKKKKPAPVKKEVKIIDKIGKKIAPKNSVRKAEKKIKPVKDMAKKTKSAPVPLHYPKISGEEYMNSEQHSHFREVLLNWKKQLLGEMERTVHHMQDEAANFPDPNDRATQEEEFSLELRARDRERKLIKKIDEALQRLDIHDYGYCEACGVEIGVQRLNARPTATLCIDCKTIDEIREKHFS